MLSRLALVLALVTPSVAGAQAVRVDRKDTMTDQRDILVIVSAPAGNAQLILGCKTPRLIFHAEDLGRRTRSLLVRVDTSPPSEVKTSTTRGGLIEVDAADEEKIVAQLPGAKRLVIRTTEPTNDFVFDLEHDNKHAFSLTAEVLGADGTNARIGFDVLTEGVAGMAAGHDQNMAELFTAMKVTWRGADGRPLETGAFIGGTISALSNTKNPRTVEDAGRVLFGPAWTAMRPMAQGKGEQAYRKLNQPIGPQLDWLKATCKN